MKVGFVSRLESLRGVAALSVAIGHALGAIAISDPFSSFLKQMANVVGNGGASVTIFFVLSGYVLGLSLDRQNRDFWSGAMVFIFRRIVRIYPAMLICLAGCGLYIFFVHPLQIFPAASESYYSYWRNGVTWGQLWGNIILTQTYVNPVTWTLQVELLAALCLPLMHRAERYSPGLSIGLIFAWAVFFFVVPINAYKNLGFLFMFQMGLAIPRFSTLLACQFTPATLRAIGLISLLACFSANQIYDETYHIAWALEALSASILIAALAASGTGEKFPILDTRAAHFLGKISYSFYLWHFPVLYILGVAMFLTIDNALLLRYPMTAQVCLAIVSVFFTIGVANQSYRFLEKPFMTFGKSLFDRRRLATETK